MSLAGIANSGAALDECGMCGGNGGACVGCDGVAYSGMDIDSCGNCGGGDDHCQDPYALSLAGAGACSGGVVVVRWQATQVKVSHLCLPCRKRTEVADQDPLMWAALWSALGRLRRITQV